MRETEIHSHCLWDMIKSFTALSVSVCFIVAVYLYSVQINNEQYKPIWEKQVSLSLNLMMLAVESVGASDKRRTSILEEYKKIYDREILVLGTKKLLMASDFYMDELKSCVDNKVNGCSELEERAIDVVFCTRKSLAETSNKAFDNLISGFSARWKISKRMCE
jgi:hypothetical protein